MDSMCRVHGTYEDAGSQLVEARDGRRVPAGAAVKARTPLKVLLRVWRLQTQKETSLRHDSVMGLYVKDAVLN